MDYYREVLEFDSSGNLIMTTRDKVATGSITYRTIGWTIKRFDSGVYDIHNQCAFIPVTTLADSMPDPENPAYKYSYFYCDRETIFEAIGNVSAEWQQSLYTNGGTVFLDAIMTVCDHGVPRGALLDTTPTCTGDVYFTFDGIVNAAAWRDPSSLLSHYSKNLSFPANPSFLVPENPPYTVTHYEIKDGGTFSLARYGKDCSGTFRDFFTIPVADFSANYFRFHYGEARIRYPDGTCDVLTFSNTSPSAISNGLHNITEVTVCLYYVRSNPTENFTLNCNYDPVENRPLISAAGTLSSNEANAIYQPSQAIPSGSLLDVHTSLTPYAFTASYVRHWGQFTFPITVQTTFLLEWNDSGGFHQTQETRTETYYVDRDFSFYILDYVQLYLLNRVELTQNVLENGGLTLGSPNIPEVILQNDKNPFSHWQAPDGPSLVTNTVHLQGNGQKPDIPIQSMQSVANSAVGAVTVKNDHFQIGNQLIMSSLPSSGTAPAVISPGSTSLQSLTENAVKIPEIQSNCTKSPTTFCAAYELFGQNAQYFHTYSGNPVSVHTPILTTAHISNDRGKNQLVSPDESRASLILGQSFLLRINSEGSHIDAPGYGTGDYGHFLREIQVCFPFEVYLGENLLAAGTWHTIQPEETFYLPAGVTEGTYDISIRGIAYNHSGEITDAVTETTANLDNRHSVTQTKLPVRVIGRLFHFGFTLEDGFHSVGTCDENGTPAANVKTLPALQNFRFRETLDFSFTTIGNAPVSGDGIRIVPTFYHISSDGKKRQPVTLYCLSGDTTLTPYEPVLNFSHKDCTYAASSDRNVSDPYAARTCVQNWTGTLDLPAPELIVPSGTDLETLLKTKGSLSLKDDIFLQDGFLLVNFTIYSIRQQHSYLSYLNLSNAALGYCNMWNTEGFSYTCSLNGTTLSLTDGDCLLFSLEENNYRIHGTH